MQEKHPELYAQHTYVEPAKRKRTVKMEVLCLSYMRTGTACLSIPSINGVGIPYLQCPSNRMPYPSFNTTSV